ncbi:MAG: tetratricopeptide repeat protein [Lachnospiraceae bacterium]|nr:tetratricopeptide repeat protein [Lachnospiraceae bacterium]
MKNKIIFLLNIAVIIFCSVILYLHFTGQYIMTSRTLTKAGVLLATYLFGVINYCSKSKSSGQATYESAYQNIIKNAFANDKTSYKQLMKSISFYCNNQPEQALKILEQLQPRCSGYQDTSAVLFFMALCYDEKQDPDKAIECYESLLQTDMAHSDAWSNLGLLYMNAKRTDKAKHALNQAILYNPGNALAYCNMAYLYYHNCEFEEAINYGLKSFQINNKISETISLLALSYASVGDSENARKYCQFYGTLQDNKPLVSMVEQQLQNK